MNWTVYWISGAVATALFAVALAVCIGRDDSFKESDVPVDLWLAFAVALFLGAVWPATVVWLAMNAISDRVRKRRMKASACPRTRARDARADEYLN